jgi:hypothetical protein
MVFRHIIQEIQQHLVTRRDTWCIPLMASGCFLFIVSSGHQRRLFFADPTELKA